MKTGNAEMDRGHRNLVEIINRLDVLADDDSGEIGGKVLCDLIDYVIAHFGHEEDLMRRSRYPGYDSHMICHCQFFTKLIGYTYAFEIGTKNLSTDMHNFLARWLLEHEATEDKHLANYLIAEAMPFIERRTSAGTGKSVIALV